RPTSSSFASLTRPPFALASCARVSWSAMALLSVTPATSASPSALTLRTSGCWRSCSVGAWGAVGVDGPRVPRGPSTPYRPRPTVADSGDRLDVDAELAGCGGRGVVDEDGEGERADAAGDG